MTDKSFTLQLLVLCRGLPPNIEAEDNRYQYSLEQMTPELLQLYKPTSQISSSPGAVGKDVVAAHWIAEKLTDSPGLELVCNCWTAILTKGGTQGNLIQWTKVPVCRRSRPTENCGAGMSVGNPVPVRTGNMECMVCM